MVISNQNKEYLERAYNICPDLGIIAETLANKGVKGLDQISINVGIPVFNNGIVCSAWQEAGDATITSSTPERMISSTSETTSSQSDTESAGILPLADIASSLHCGNNIFKFLLCRVAILPNPITATVFKT